MGRPRRIAPSRRRIRALAAPPSSAPRRGRPSSRSTVPSRRFPRGLRHSLHGHDAVPSRPQCPGHPAPPRCRVADSRAVDTAGESVVRHAADALWRILRRPRRPVVCAAARIVAGMAELVDALDSKSSTGDSVRVRVSLPAPFPHFSRSHSFPESHETPINVGIFVLYRSIRFPQVPR